jgi:hypothetical protein
VRYSPIDLNSFHNAAGATFDSERINGGVNAWGNSFPAEELPFGRTLTVADIPFLFPVKNSKFDHVEALGQTIELPQTFPAIGFAFLCFGEMGDQEIDLTVVFNDSRETHIRLRANVWLTENSQPEEVTRFTCSHLHYPGNYELAYLRPTLWCRRVAWTPASIVARMHLGMNPLFHIFAATSLHEGE